MFKMIFLKKMENKMKGIGFISSEKNPNGMFYVVGVRNMQNLIKFGE